MSVNGSLVRRARRSACSIRSSSSTRFGSPVSGSRKAWECARPSRQLSTTPDAPATKAMTARAATARSGVSWRNAATRPATKMRAARDSAQAKVPLRCRFDRIVTRLVLHAPLWGRPQYFRR